MKIIMNNINMNYKIAMKFLIMLTQIKDLQNGHLQMIIYILINKQ